MENKEFNVWSDGGIKSYQNLTTFQILAQKTQMKVTLNYFAPEHGHNICDSHFGVGKKEVRNKFSGKNIKEAKDIIEIFSKMKYTTVVQFETIPKIDEERDSSRLNGIRKWFCVEILPSKHQINCYNKTSGDIIDVLTYKFQNKIQNQKPKSTQNLQQHHQPLQQHQPLLQQTTRQRRSPTQNASSTQLNLIFQEEQSARKSQHERRMEDLQERNRKLMEEVRRV